MRKERLVAEKQTYSRDAYSVAEVVKITGFPERTVYSGVERGEIPSIRIGKSIRIPGYWLRRHLIEEDGRARYAIGTGQPAMKSYATPKRGT